MNYYIGIDLGGTNVRVCKVDEEGKIIQDVISPSYGLEGPEKIESNILDLLSKFDLSDVKSIGLAIPGPVDGEGLRYEIQEFISMIVNNRRSCYKLRRKESVTIAEIIEKYHNRENYTEI